MKGIFITATDTGVGKTVVAAGLLRACRNDGLDVMPFKPVQTGCTAGADGLVAPDLAFCLAAAGLTPEPQEAELLCPCRYEPACSPHLAGRMVGAQPEVARMVDAAKQLASRHDAIIVEGAGGLLVPLNESETMLDLIGALQLPVLIVARAALGTINHSLLSVRALRSAGLKVLGVVLNDADAAGDDFITQDNPLAIEQFGRVEVLGQIPFIEPLTTTQPPADAWRIFEQNLPGLGKLMEVLK